MSASRSDGLLIRGARLLTSPHLTSLLLSGGRVAEIGRESERASRMAARAVDGDGLLVAPGYMELQVNGAAGHDLTTSPEMLWDVAKALVNYGVTSFLATAVSPSQEAVQQLQAALRAGPPSHFLGAVPLGLHVEGPLINPQRRGAHEANRLRLPGSLTTATWTRTDGVRLVTIAPELPGALELIRELRRAGVAVAAGHSNASLQEAETAIDAGITYGTHLFNAMPVLDHRAPGLVAALLRDQRVTVGLIADGTHVDPAMVDIVWRVVGKSRLSLVSDATAALGMPPGRYRLGAAVVETDSKSARAGSRLAGGVVPLDACVRNLIRFTGASAPDAIRTVTTVPSRLLGERTRGRLSRGSRADLVVLSPELEVAATIVGGRVAYTTPRTASWA